MRTVKGRYQFIFAAALAIALIMSMSVMALPGRAQAFGSLSENGTAKYMGIGIATAVRPLHLFGNVALFERAQDSAGFIIQRTNENRWVLGVNEDDDLGHGFVLSTYPIGTSSSVPRLMITPDGNVGIGTTSPGSKYKLHVESDNDTVNSAAIRAVSDSAKTHAVHGFSGSGTGLFGESISNYGVFGATNSGIGVYGSANSGDGVYGYSSKGYAGYFNGRTVITDNLSVGKTTAANSTLQIDGSLATAYRKVTTTPYTATANDSVIAVDCGTSLPSITVYLPTAVGIEGRTYTVKKVSSGANAAIVNPNGSQTIDGDASKTLSSQWEYISVVSDGENWLITASN